MSRHLIWPMGLALIFVTTALIVVVLTGLRDPVKPTVWHLVERTTTQGDKVDLACVQWTNRLDLASRASVPLKLGDKVKTVCTVVPKPAKAKS